MSDETMPDPDETPSPTVVEIDTATAEVEGTMSAVVFPVEVHDTITAEEPPSEAPEMTMAPADNTPTLEAVADLRASLEKRLDSLQRLFDREIRAEATREKVVDRLHAELQEYKQDLLLNTLRPMFIDLIQLHDDIGKMIDAQVEPDGEVARLLDVMRGFQQGIEDILYRQGVEPFHVEDRAFDPRRQRAVSTVPTEELDAAKTVAVRHRKGFRAGRRSFGPKSSRSSPSRRAIEPEADTPSSSLRRSDVEVRWLRLVFLP